MNYFYVESLMILRSSIKGTCSIGIWIEIQIIIGRIRFMLAIMVILVMIQTILLIWVMVLYVAFFDVFQVLPISEQIRFVPVNKVLSTATNRLYKYIATTGITYINDTHMEELDSVQKFIEIGWLLLRFFICLHNQLSSFNSVIVQVSEKHDSSSRQ